MSLGQQYQAQSSWLPTHVQVTVLQARGLRSKGKAGTNDAYAIIQLGKEKYSTTVAEKSHAPVWKEEATFELPLLHQDHRGRGTLRLIIMHRALVGLDKHLGEVGLDLYQLHQERSRRKTQWYKLQSKPGKKAKERGEIELDVQFMRNNMTASMFDLSMKEKSRSPFGKLKDKMKGKRHDGFPDTASAIVPSFTQPGADSDEEGPEKVTKKKSKLKNLFSKPGLQKSPLSQSMLVLPSFQPSPLAERKVLRPSDFSSDFNDVPLSTDEPAPNKVEGKPPHFPVIMTHKRTVSADTKQINQIVPGTNKKEGLSFFSGLRSKNDPITRSNVCINGNHVYNEETEPKPDVQAKDNTLSFTPKIIRKTPIYSSIEDLSTKSSSSESLSSKITVEAFEPASSLPDKRSSWALSKDSLKSMTLPSFKPSNGEESQEANLVGSSDPTKEAKESKKPESLKSSLLSLVTGKKEVSKDLSKGEAVTQTSVKEEQLKSEDISPKHSADVSPQHSSVVASTEIPSPKESLNPFEEDLKQDEQKPVPLPPSTRTPKTTAVKPRLDVSSEAETKAKLFPPSVTGPSHSPSMFLSSNMDDSFASVPALSARRHPTNTDHNVNLCSPVDPSDSLPLSSAVNLPFPSETLPAKGVSPSSNQLADGSSLLASEHLTLPSQGEPETKEVLPVPQFNNQMSSNKTTVRSLLDQLKGKKADTGGERLERAGKLESQASGPNPKSFLEKNQELAPGKDGVNEFPASPENHAERLDYAESNRSKSKAEAIIHVRDISSSFIPNQMKTSIPLDNVQNQTDVLPSDLIFPKRVGRTPYIKDGALKFEDADDLPNVNFDNEDLLVKDLDQNIQPKPMPRTQIASPKVTTEEDSDLPLHAVPTPPKPAPRSVVKSSRNAANPIASVVAPVNGPPKPPRALTTFVKDGSSFEHYGPNEKDELEYIYIKDSEMKMASPALVDLKFRLDELPVIPENPEVMSDDDLAPCQASIAVREPSDAGLSARNVPHSVAEKATNPAKTSVDQKVVKENPHDGKLKKQNLSFKSSRSQSSNVAVETNANIDFTNECEPTFNHVQESNALSDLSNNQVNDYPQKADSSAVFPSSTSALNSSISLPSNPSRAKEADSPTRPPAVGTDRAESTGKKKLLRAWVSPSETPPIQAPPSAAVPATLRPHPVKPMSTNPVKASSFGTAIKNQENAFMEPKKYDPSDPAASYGQLTHDELIKLVLKQKDTITKKESQVQELEEYIDNLLVRVMEEMPNILISMAEDSKKSGKV